MAKVCEGCKYLKVLHEGEFLPFSAKCIKHDIYMHLQSKDVLKKMICVEDKVCRECEYLKIVHRPEGHELGVAECTKHGLMTNFRDMSDKKLMTVASFFAGVGGIDLGFEQTGRFKTVYANEFDPYPVKTFEKNFDVRVDCRDIREVMPADVPEVDGYIFGFPCQAFSVAGYRQGFNDEKGRGNLFFEVMRLVREKHPRFLLAENVKNLVGHDGGHTFAVILEALQVEGYRFRYKVLNAMEYGNTPQNRERIYIVAFRDEADYMNFSFPDPIPLTKKLTDIIDFENKVPEKYYYTPGKYKGDIYEQLEAAMDDPDTVYQWRRKYVRKNMSGVVPTLTANQGEGGHNVCLIKTKYGIRKMTPHECFNAQGFPEDFQLPDKMVDSRLYKQAGNSVCVGVINRIAEKMAEAMKNNG